MEKIDFRNLEDSVVIDKLAEMPADKALTYLQTDLQGRIARLSIVCTNKEVKKLINEVTDKLPLDNEDEMEEDHCHR